MTQPDAGGTQPPALRRFWRRRTVLLAIAVALLAAGGVVAVVTSRTPDPVEVVRQYFAAIRARDVDAALRAAGVERPTGEAAAFLTAEALSSDWDVVDIAVDQQGSRKAWVDVTLPMYPRSAADGFRAGQPTATETVMLTKDDSWGGRWRIANPFSWTNASGSALRYFEVNGKTVSTWAPPTPPKQIVGLYVMLPGVYTFYRTVPDLVSFEPVKLTLMPGAGGGQQVEGPVVTLTPKAEELARQQANAYLDRCASRVDLEVGKEPCPFDLGANSVETAEGRYTIVREARWTVVRYPTLSVSVSAGGITISVAQPGLVQLAGTGFRDGRRQAFTTRCEVGDFVLVAGLVSPTELRLEPPGKTVRGTCRQPVGGR